MTAETQPKLPTPAPQRSDLHQCPPRSACAFRIKTAGRRFHANDNISEFIRDGEATELQAKSKPNARGSESLVIDTENDHNTQDTAKRVAKMFLNEVFRGRYTAQPR